MDSIKLGTVGEWVGGIATASAFLWTLLAWQRERTRLARHEEASAELALRNEAALVTSWAQRLSSDLRRSAAMGLADVPDGSWVLVVRNATIQIISEWWVTARVEPPGHSFRFASESLYPLPPESIVVMAMTGISSAENPLFDVLDACRRCRESMEPQREHTRTRGAGLVRSRSTWPEVL